MGEASVSEEGGSGRSFSRSLRRSFSRSFRACLAGTLREKKKFSKTSALNSHDSAQLNRRNFREKLNDLGKKKPINIKNFGGTPPGVRPVCPGDTSHLSRDMSRLSRGTFCPFSSVGHRAGESEPGPTTKKNKWELRVVLAST